MLLLGKDLGESERPWYADGRRVELFSAHRRVCHSVNVHAEHLWRSDQLHGSINVTLEEVHGKFERFVTLASLPVAEGLQELVLVQLSWHGHESLQELLELGFVVLPCQVRALSLQIVPNAALDACVVFDCLSGEKPLQHAD